jgi:hypothetical protein
MDTLAYPIFSIMSALIRGETIKLMDLAYLEMAKNIIKIALLIETFFIMRAGYIIVGSKTTEDEKNPDLQELTYHALVVCAVLFFIKTNTGPLDFILGIKSMIIAEFTGDKNTPGGQQIAESLAVMDTAYAISNVYNTTIGTTSASLKSTLITLSLGSMISPQIMGAVLLLFTEIMTRVGMALFPLVAYAALYKTTRDIFMTWLGLMFSLGLVTAASAVITKLVATTTVAFVAGFGLIVAAQNLRAKLGDPIISELQQSLIQGGFGFTMSILLLQVPTNISSFAGGFLNFAGPTLNNELGALYHNKRTYKKR